MVIRPWFAVTDSARQSCPSIVPKCEDQVQNAGVNSTLAIPNQYARRWKTIGSCRIPRRGALDSDDASIFSLRLAKVTSESRVTEFGRSVCPPCRVYRPRCRKAMHIRDSRSYTGTGCFGREIRKINSYHGYVLKLGHCGFRVQLPCLRDIAARETQGSNDEQHPSAARSSR